MNVEVAVEENDDIMHKARHVIELTREWINKPFGMDTILNVPTL